MTAAPNTAAASRLIAERWQSLQPRSCASADWSALLDELFGLYRAPDRHYHDTRHIAALLDVSGRFAGDLGNPAAVDLAIVFHDAIYDPSRNDNEVRSADLAHARLQALGVAPAACAVVRRYIEATQHTTAITTDDRDLDHFLDFDLQVLAAPSAEYAAYAAAIRMEYALYPDAIYRAGRARVLRHFLAMPHIYRVPRLRDLWEAHARSNLTAELAKLG